MDWSTLLSALAGLAVPALAGYLALQYMKSVWPWLDARKPVVKQLIFFGWGLLAAYVAPMIGLTLPDLAALGDPTAVAGVLTTLIGFLIHKFFRPKTA